ncbi:MAG: hypothetical protein WKF37_16415 [Bryobacteraceae bacterium]
MGEGSIFGRMEGVGNDGRETGQGDDIDGIVVEDGDDPERFLGSKIFEVDVRNHLARQIAFAFDPQDLSLEVD